MHVLLILIHLLSLSHDFHVSQCEVQYRPADSQVAAALHIFIDDLELALSQFGYDSVYLGTEKEHKGADAMILKYLEDHFVIELDGRQVRYQLLGKEVSEDLMGLWCYIEALDVPPFSAATIQNKVLLETYADQKNILSFEYLGYPKQHYLFDRKDPVRKFLIE